MKRFKSFWAKCIPFNSKEYGQPYQQNFSETHLNEANPHLVCYSDLTNEGINEEAASFLIEKWNKMGNPKYVYSLRPFGEP